MNLHVEDKLELLVFLKTAKLRGIGIAPAWATNAILPLLSIVFIFLFSFSLFLPKK
jgi:hypothetical protein